MSDTRKFEADYVAERVESTKTAEAYNRRMMSLPIGQRLELWKRVNHGENGVAVLAELEPSGPRMFVLTSGQLATCPIGRLDVGHWREDRSCKCQGGGGDATAHADQVKGSDRERDG